MIQLAFENGRLTLLFPGERLTGRHAHQLAYWGFRTGEQPNALVSSSPEVRALSKKVVSYFTRHKIDIELDEAVTIILQQNEEEHGALQQAITQGRNFKDGIMDKALAGQFLRFAKQRIPRTLKPHQEKAALHFVLTKNAANFSVPGSGKTTVVLAVYEWLRLRGDIDALFVVGPPACFGPWRDEFNATLGRCPTAEILAGGDRDLRKQKYYANRSNACELYLTSFQTLQRDWMDVKVLFESQGIRFLLVVDEAHYIKQVAGTWATAVLRVGSFASRRCVLTGTPFPRRFSDVFNLVDVLWPHASPLTTNDRHAIERLTDRNELAEATQILDTSIGPLFYRVRKHDLGLAQQVFHEPIHVHMREYERRIYDAIVGRVQNLAELDSHKTVDLLFKLRRGRMMRLRQCVSNAGLLSHSFPNDNEESLSDTPQLQDFLTHYSELETPAKLDALLDLVERILHENAKVVIWSNFVGTLHLLCDALQNSGHTARLIFGGTPIHEVETDDALSRDSIIREFCRLDSGVDVLVANPGACAESISLHKTCSHAIYYDISYNCAQYLQSLDRIHRVGGSETKVSNYYFLQYIDSLDTDILKNVQDKAARMSAIIDRDYAVYSLDMFNEDEELEAYERLFGSTGKSV